MEFEALIHVTGPVSFAEKCVIACHDWLYFSLVEKVARVFLTNHRPCKAKAKQIRNSFRRSIYNRSLPFLAHDMLQNNCFS